MEASPEDHLDSSKSPNTGVMEKNAATPAISPKKPIQLGVVQSSLGVRSAVNVNQTKKSRWDQAPELEENEGEVNIQHGKEEESNIKNLIKKFENISDSSKLESGKSDDSSNLKPTRVKLVRTNFSKFENPRITLPNEKEDIETTKCEKGDVKSVDSTESVSDILPVSSSKALQIISSNYDSPSDESSQEADNIISIPKHETPSDSAYTSLERLTEIGDEGEKESLEERLDSSISPINEPEPKIEESKMEIDMTDEVLERDLKQVNSADLKSAERSDIVEMVMDIPDSQNKEEEIGETKGTSGGVYIDKNNEHEKMIEDRLCESGASNQDLKQSSHLLDENILNENDTIQEEGSNIIQEEVSEHVKFVHENLISQKSDGGQSNDPNINNLQFQEETIEIETVNEKNTKSMTDLAEKSLDVGSCGETGNLSGEDNNDFVIVTHADVAGFTDGKSSLATVSTLEGEELKPSTSDTFKDGNFKDMSSFDSKENKTGDLNSPVMGQFAEIDSLVDTPTEKIITSEKTNTESFENIQKDNDENVLIFESEKIPSSEKKVCEMVPNDVKTQSDSDYIDAKMEQIFSENAENIIEATSSSKEFVDVLVSDTQEPFEEELISENLFDTNEPSNDQSKNALETNDSLLEILQSGGSPETPACSNKHTGSLQKMETERSLEEHEIFNIDSENNDLKTKVTTFEEKSLSQESKTEQYTDNAPNEKVITDKVDLESGKDTNNIVPDNISNSENIDGKINNLGLQNIPRDVSLNTFKNQTLESEVLVERNQQVQESNSENYDVSKQTEEEIKSKPGVSLKDIEEMEESEIVIEEVENIQPSDVMIEGSPQIIESEISGENNVNFSDRDSTDPQTQIESCEPNKELVIKEMEIIEEAENSKLSQVLGNFEVQSMEAHEVITKPNESDESIKTDEVIDPKTEEVIEPSEKTDNTKVSKSSNIVDDFSVTEKEEFVNEATTGIIDRCAPEINKISDSDFLNPNQLDAKSNTELMDTSLTSYQEKKSNDLKEETQVEHTSNTDLNYGDINVTQTSKDIEGSIEVSQQETIERSIDMLFDVPMNDQMLNANLASSTSSSRDTKLEVSNETKQLFSEEMHKEMLKISPEHETQCEIPMVDVPNLGNDSPQNNDAKIQNKVKSEEIVSMMDDSCDLPIESELLNEPETLKLTANVDIEKETLEQSDDSDTATIQAIDSFLEGDTLEINKSLCESTSTPENKSKSVGESHLKITELSHEGGSNFFVGPSSTSERTNAEDVMLGVEGELDLDNSLTYETKKLDLSPSSEPVSEENYDLPGDSYDKESLVKDQENSNLISEVLDDVDVNIKDSELMIPVTRNVSEKQSLLGSCTIPDDHSTDEVCIDASINKKDCEGEVAAAASEADIDLSIKDPELMTDRSDSEMETKDSNLEDYECFNTETSVPSNKLSKEEHEVCNSQVSKIMDEKEISDSQEPQQSQEKQSADKDEYVCTVSNMSQQTSLANKAENLDFETLIPSSTLSSIVESEVDSCAKEVDSFKNQNQNDKDVQIKENKELVPESDTKLSEKSSPEKKSDSEENKVISSVGNVSSDIDKSNKKVPHEQAQQSEEMNQNIDEPSDINEGSKMLEEKKSSQKLKFESLDKETTSKTMTSIKVTPVTCSSLVELKSPKKDIPNLSNMNTDDNISSETNLPNIISLCDQSVVSLDPSSKQTSLTAGHVESESSKDDMPTKTLENIDEKSISNILADSETFPPIPSTNQVPTEAISPVLEQIAKPKLAPAKEIPAPVRVSARQKQRQAAAAAALAAKEKEEATKSPGQGTAVKKGSVHDKQGDKRMKKSLSPTKELHIKVSGKSSESGKLSPLIGHKSPKNVESKVSSQISPKKITKEFSQDKLEPITLKLSKEENPVIVRSSSLSPKKSVSPHSPQGKTLGYTLKIGKDSTTIIPKESTPSPTRKESSPGTGSTKADISSKVGYLIKDTGLTITPVAPAETHEQKLNKITLKLSKAGGHPEIKQENKSETWKAIRKLGEIDIVPVESKGSVETSKRKDKSDDESPEKKIKLGDVTVEPSTSSGVSKLQGLLTQAPLNQSDSSEEGKFIGFASPTEKVSPSQQQQSSYDIGMIRHDDSPQPPRKRGRPRKITSPDDVVHSVSVPHTLPAGLTAKDILAASLQQQSLQQHMHPSFQPQQSYQPPEDLDSSQPMVPLFDLFEETFMDPSPPTIFPDQVQPSTEIIMRSARGRPIGRSRRPRGSGLMRGHERGGPRGRPRGSRGMKRMLEEMEVMSFRDPDQPITLENIDAEMGPRMAEQAASELTMTLLRKSIEGKKEILEKKARRSDGSEEGNSNLDAQVKEMKEKIEAAYQAELKSPGKEPKKKTPEKIEIIKKSPPGLIPLQKQEERRKSAEGKETAKRKLSEDKSDECQQQPPKRKSTDGKSECPKSEVVVTEESEKDDSPMEVDQAASPSKEPNEQEEEKKEPEPPPKPVKPRPRSKAEIKRIKREKDRLRREAKKLAALEALKAPPPNPCEEDTRMSASDPNGEGVDGDGSGIKKNRMEVGDPEGKEFTVEQIAEYQWPLQGGELYMIQEQISTWLGVKSFQRKYPDLKRRRVEMEERTYLCDSGLVAESMCDLGLTAVSSSEVLDVMFQDFPEQYEELRKHMREKQARELINKQKEKKKFEQTLSKSDLKEHAIQSLVSWNANLNKSRNENRKCHLDLQTWTIQYPRSKAAKMTRPSGKLGSYPVALIPGQYSDYYKKYTPQELRYFPVNTVLYGPLQPNEMHSTGGSDGSQSESEDSSSSDGTSDSSSDGEGEGTEEEEKSRECKTCGGKKSGEAMVQCSQCSHHIHVTCADLNPSMMTHVRKYQWQCSVCKTCQRCNNAKNESKMLFCDMCDRGYHIYCVGLRRVPSGTWTCETCTHDSGS